ncbi:MAG: metal-dependent transcriptional regulator [Spirochaetaceae bacterium]|nr:metal-dependent transcriptional regulator [Spirochaetaceae bacterium]
MYESGENYLETIYMLQKEQGFVRSIDIARKLDVSKPSVSRAMGLLRQEGFIDMADNGPIVLTDKGLEKAEQIYTRHRILTDFLVKVTGVPMEQAEENACRIEHVLDEDVFQGIQRYMSSSLK